MGPTWRSELRRGVNAHNLSVGAAASAAAALLHLVLGGPPWQAALVFAAGVLLTTGIHTAAHVYFGWRFERGIRAHREGDHHRAAALLAPAELPHMDHYDEDGTARGALRAAREACWR